jgi:hypothetical protein
MKIRTARRCGGEGASVGHVVTDVTKPEGVVMSRTVQTVGSAPPDAVVHEALAQEVDRYEAVEQYSLAKILGVWAAAVPMGVLAWVVAPLLRDQLGGRDPFAEALLICLTAGLVWQFVLTLMLVSRELGGLQWSRVRQALWLRPPLDPKTRRVGGKVWWWALLFPGFRSWRARAGDFAV